jgi:hypothetical protein
MVRATHLTPEHIVRAIKAGDSYASSGVTLADVKYDPAAKTLAIAIEPDGDATYTTQFIGTLRGYDDTNSPALDKEGKPLVDKNGKPLRASRKYSGEVGQVLATAEGLSAKYTLTGQGAVRAGDCDEQQGSGRSVVQGSEAASLDTAGGLGVGARERGGDVAAVERVIVAAKLLQA